MIRPSMLERQIAAALRGEPQRQSRIPGIRVDLALVSENKTNLAPSKIAILQSIAETVERFRSIDRASISRWKAQHHFAGDTSKSTLTRILVSTQITAKWLYEPTSVYRQKHGAAEAATRINFEPVIRFYKGAPFSGVEIPMTDGLTFQAFVLKAGKRLSPTDDFISGPFQRYLTVGPGFISLPVFMIHESDCGFIFAVAGRGLHNGTPSNSFPVNVDVKFALPEKGVGIDPVLQKGVPLKGHLPNTYVFHKPFVFSFRDSASRLILEGTVR